MEADVEQENWDASTISSGRPSPVKSCNVIVCSVALNLPPFKTGTFAFGLLDYLCCNSQVLTAYYG